MPIKRTPTATLAASNPDIAAQWHPDKNAKLLPTDITAGSNRRVWWRCATKPLHEWDAVIANRAKGDGCPYCSKRRVMLENSLAASHPAIAAEWHPEKNNGLLATEVGSGSGRRVWWRCATDCRHVWSTLIVKRTARSHGCPYCAGRVCLSEDSISATHPETAALWDHNNNGSTMPTDVSFGSNREFAWVCPAGHRWRNTVQQQVFRGDCLYCKGRPIGYEPPRKRDEPFTIEHPEIAADWHPHLNGIARPEDFTGGSGFMAWWQCPRRPDHKWRTSIANRCKSGGTKCPKCAWPQTSRPELRVRAELEYIFPDAIGRHRPLKDSRKEVDVYLPSYRAGIEYDGARYHQSPQYDEAKRREIEEGGTLLFRVREQPLSLSGERDIRLVGKFQFRTMVDLLSQIATHLPLISADRRRVEEYIRDGAFQAVDRYSDFVNQLPGPNLENSLAEKFPEIAAELHPTLNHGLAARDVTFGSNEHVWWQCSMNIDHVWKAPPSRRTGLDRRGCPHCYLLNKPEIGRAGSARRLAVFYEHVKQVVGPIVANMRRDGAHDGEIAAELNQRGIPARKSGPWSKQRVYLVRHLFARLSGGNTPRSDTKRIK
jgi:hypothetical protein